MTPVTTVRAARTATLILAFASRTAVAQEPKVDCTIPMATFEMNICAGREFEAADAELNAVYKRALKDIPGMATDKPYDARSWEEALRKSQRAWLAYRDAECEGHVPMFWSGGTGATADMTGCMTELTKARAKELRERYEGGENAPAEPEQR